jgi:hypothetical protein
MITSMPLTCMPHFPASFFLVLSQRAIRLYDVFVSLNMMCQCVSDDTSDGPDHRGGPPDSLQSCDHRFQSGTHRRKCICGHMALMVGRSYSKRMIALNHDSVCLKQIHVNANSVSVYIFDIDMKCGCVRIKFCRRNDGLASTH